MIARRTILKGVAAAFTAPALKSFASGQSSDRS